MLNIRFAAIRISFANCQQNISNGVVLGAA